MKTARRRRLDWRGRNSSNPEFRADQMKDKAVETLQHIGKFDEKKKVDKLVFLN